MLAAGHPRSSILFVVSQVVSVGDDVSEIFETSCGALAFAAGSTIYELTDVDLGSRELEVLDLSSSSCTTSSAPSSADCYTCVAVVVLFG